MNWLSSDTSVVGIFASAVLAFMAYELQRVWTCKRDLEHHVKQILRTRYTHPEELSEALSDAGREFPKLAPAGHLGVSDNKGSFILRHDHLRGHQPLPGTRMPPPPMPEVKPAPDQDGKTLESCKACFPAPQGTLSFAYERRAHRGRK